MKSTQRKASPSSGKRHRRVPVLAAVLVLAASVFAVSLWFTGIYEGAGDSAADESAAPPKLRPSGTPGLRNTEIPKLQPPAVVRSADGDILSSPPLPALAEAVSPTSDLDFDARLAVVHAHDTELTAEQVEALLDFIRSGDPLPEVDAAQRAALENDLLNLLQRQSAHRDLVMEALAAIAGDEALPALKRDYALQHLASMEESLAADGPHWAVVENGEPGLAATAMLHVLAQGRGSGPRGSDRALDRETRARLGRAALALAESREDPASRATALQVCGRLGLEDVRPVAMAVAADETATFPLRIAAIATVGDLAPRERSLHLLTELSAGPEKRLRLPARSALTRLSAL